MKKQSATSRKIKALILAGAGLLAGKNAKASAEVLYAPGTSPEQKNKIEAAMDLLAEEHPDAAFLKYRRLPSADDYIGDVVIDPNHKGYATYTHGTKRIGVTADRPEMELAEDLNHEGLHMANTLSSPELVALNKALTHGDFYTYQARGMQSEAASWSDSAMFMLRGKGREDYIRQNMEIARKREPAVPGKPDMINYWFPANYVAALIAYYYGGAIDMPEDQKVREIGDEIYNNFYKNGAYLNKIMLSGSNMSGDIGFIKSKYAATQASKAFLERYMQLTCPKGVTRTVTGGMLLDMIRAVMESKDPLVDITGEWKNVRNTVKGNFAEVGKMWEHNSRMVNLVPSIKQKVDPRDVETHFGNILSLPTAEELGLLDKILAAAQQNGAARMPAVAGRE